MEHKINVKSLRELLGWQQVKKIMVAQLVVSVSMFSLVRFWWSSSSPLMYYEKLYCFSYRSLQLLSIAMNKNCIFLICNGILVFLAKTCPLVPSPSPSDLNIDALQKNIHDGLQIHTESAPVSKNDIMLEETDSASEEEEEDEDDGEFECWNERAEEVSINSIADSDEGGGGLSGHEYDVENDEGQPQKFDDNNNDDEEGVYAEEEEEDGGIEKLSTEELNQKFEDFIRRMKEDFRINNQLVMVN